MKKVLSLVLATLMMCGCVLLASCGDKTQYIGVQRGTTGEYFVDGSPDFAGLKNNRAKTYDTAALAIADMKNGQFDTVIVDKPTAMSLSKDIEGVKIIDIGLTVEAYGYGVDKNQPELLTKVNKALNELIADGTVKEITERYMNDGTPNLVTNGVKDDSKADKQLVMATNAEFPPFEFKEGDKFAGIDVEIMKKIADKLEMELVIMDMDFDSVVTSIGKNNIDIAAAALTINADRKKSVNFTDPYFSDADTTQVVVVLKDNTKFNACKTKEDVINVLEAK